MDGLNRRWGGNVLTIVALGVDAGFMRLGVRGYVVEGEVYRGKSMKSTDLNIGREEAVLQVNLVLMC